MKLTRFPVLLFSVLMVELASTQLILPSSCK